ncbi:MAG: hypothetical protein ACP5I4_12505 [Oceanipulchritudo sp.]
MNDPSFLPKAAGVFARLALTAAVFGATPAGALTLYTVDTEKEPEPAQPEMVLSYGYPDVDRAKTNPAQLAETLRILDKDLGGVERYFYQNDPYADTHVILDGHWLLNPEEAAIRLKISRPEKLKLQIDYYRWMEYDYGAGNYYPPRDAFFVLSPDALEEEINRLKVRFELALTDTLKLKLNYRLLDRDGGSLSTRFGDDFQYQVTGSMKSRNIVPALNTGKETVHAVDLSLVRQEYINRSGLRVHFQRRETERQRLTERAASQPTANRFTTHEENTSDDIYGFSAYTRRELSDQSYGSMGVAFNRLNGEVGGSRIFGATPDDLEFAALQLDDREFLNLENTRRLKQWIFNLNLVREPEGNYRWMGGLRYERLSSSAFSSYIDVFETVDFGDLERQTQEADMISSNDKSSEELSGFVELRYKGIPKGLLYTRVEGAWQTGDLQETWTRAELAPNPADPESILGRDTDFSRDLALWELGMNYYPSSNLRLSVEGYLKYRDYDYGDMQVTQGISGYAYPGWILNQTFKTRDLNARLHWRILPELKSVSRVDFQKTEVTSERRGTDGFTTSERDRVTFNQSLTWTPHPRIFLNANYMLSDDLTETGAADLEGTYSGIVVDIPNDYWQVDLNVYCVLTRIIDLHLGYHYLEMSNYLDTSPNTVPYGADIRQHQGNAGLVFHLSEKLVTRLGYQYYEQTDPSAAGMRDYQVHLISGSAQCKF